jgi:hypothetical protein
MYFDQRFINKMNSLLSRLLILLFVLCLACSTSKSPKVIVINGHVKLSVSDAYTRFGVSLVKDPIGTLTISHVADSLTALSESISSFAQNHTYEDYDCGSPCFPLPAPPIYSFHLSIPEDFFDEHSTYYIFAWIDGNSNDILDWPTEQVRLPYYDSCIVKGLFTKDNQYLIICADHSDTIRVDFPDNKSFEFLFTKEK